jgi:UDP-glucose:(heptosyl)LPS alpha-1,3-glucosyltransferase
MAMKWSCTRNGVNDVGNLRRPGEDVCAGGRICWHQVGQFPGPLLLGFRGWLWLSRRAQAREVQRSGKKPGRDFFSGVNALDADVILVHAVFHRLAELQTARDHAGLRGLHRRLYYAMLCKLEQQIYGDPRVKLAAVSKHTAEQLKRYFGRADVAVIPNGVDVEHFSPKATAPLRDAARKQRYCSPEQTVLLLIGNDWRNKGLGTLLVAVANCKDLPLRLLVVGQDEQTPFRAQAAAGGVLERVEFCAPIADVRSLYAAADILVGAIAGGFIQLAGTGSMACGLPVIVSSKAGVSEWLAHGFDALLPERSGEYRANWRMRFARWRAVSQLRKTLAENAVVTARKFSWDRTCGGVAPADGKRLRRRRKAARLQESRLARCSLVLFQLREHGLAGGFEREA